MKSSVRGRLMCVCLLLFYVARLCATDPKTRITQYGHTAWRVQDGVLSAAPTAIVQTRDGYLWIGTETGLLRFDGIRFTPWNSSQVVDPQVTALLAASDGTLWIGTPSDLVSWKEGKATTFAVHGHTNSIVEQSHGRIWAAVSRSPDHRPLCDVSNGKVKCYGAAEGVPFPYGGALSPDGDGNLLVASASEVIRWSPERGLLSSFTFDALTGTQSLHGIEMLQADADGSSLVSIGFAGKGLGLQRWTGQTPSTYMAPGLDGSSIEAQATYRDRAGSLWIGTYSDGLYRVSAARTEHFTSKDGLSGDSVRNFREDREGNLWVATDQGVDCFRDLKVVSWTNHEGMSSGFVSSVLAAHDGTVLIGTHSALNILRQDHITSIGQTQGLPAQGVTALLEDRSGHFWMGVGNQLAKYDGNKFTVVSRPDGQPVGVVVALAMDGEGGIWASTLGPHPGLIRVMNGMVEAILPEVTKAVGIAPDSGTGVWIHERTRIGHFSDGRLQWFPFKLRFGGSVSLVTAPDGAVFASSPDGLWAEKDGKVQVMGSANGLPCKSTNGLAFSARQQLLVRTPCGLIEMEPDDLRAWWSNPAMQIPYRLIDSFDGAHLSYATFTPQMSRAPDGRIWIANQGGIQVFDPDHVPMNSLPPPVYIEGIFADRKHFEPLAGLKLPALTRDIEIQYTALSFTVPQKVRFRYLLEGRDTTWQEPGARRTAFYQDLKPGHYLLHVIAANNDGVWNTTGGSFAFDVQPAWFQTVWFRVLWITLACLLVWVLYRLRVHSIAKAINARFDERLDERTRMALELHDTFLQTVQGSKMVADDALDPDADQPRMRHALEKLSLWLGQAVTEGRAALHALRVTTTERNHLAEFLDRTAKEHSQRTSISVALIVIGDAKDAHPIVRDEISRIAEEAIRNACLHSNASQLSIELRYAGELNVCIRDNGVGIDPEIIETGKAEHFGIQGMKERSARIRAKLTITSNRNKGTEINLTVPGTVIYRRKKRRLLERMRTLHLWRSRPRNEAPRTEGHGHDVCE